MAHFKYWKKYSQVWLSTHLAGGAVANQETAARALMLLLTPFWSLCLRGLMRSADGMHREALSILHRQAAPSCAVLSFLPHLCLPGAIVSHCTLLEPFTTRSFYTSGTSFLKMGVWWDWLPETCMNVLISVTAGTSIKRKKEKRTCGRSYSSKIRKHTEAK